MKVLKKGKEFPPKKWSAEVVCRNQNCEALLLVEEEDVSLLSEIPLRYKFRCPECGKNTPVSLTESEALLLAKAIERRYATREIDSLEGNRG